MFVVLGRERLRQRPCNRQQHALVKGDRRSGSLRRTAALAATRARVRAVGTQVCFAPSRTSLQRGHELKRDPRRQHKRSWTRAWSTLTFAVQGLGGERNKRGGRYVQIPA